MRKSIIKKAGAVVMALALTIASTATCFADWSSYFGMNMGWYEGSLGELKSSSATGWEAFLEQIGWGGVWGAQIKDEAISLDAGVEYELSFDITSDTVDKWVFVKITDASGEDPVLYGAWVQAKAGQTVNFNKKFTLESPATKIFFGCGGEMGDRADEEDLYALCDTTPSDVDPLYSTTLTVSNYSLKAAAAEAPSEDVEEPSDDVVIDGGDEDENAGGNAGGNEDTTTKAPTTGTTTTPQTGDFSPIACAAIAIVAAAGIVVFTRKREEA